MLVESFRIAGIALELSAAGSEASSNLMEDLTRSYEFICQCEKTVSSLKVEVIPTARRSENAI